MPFTKIGASTKEFLKLDEYAKNFDLLEIDLEKASKLEDIDNILRKAEPYIEQIYSVHLRYKPENSLSGIEVTLRDMSLIKKFGAEIVVTHTEYPKTPYELKQQLKIIGDKAAELEVYVAIENLADRENKTNGCIWSRDPCRIAESLAELANKYLGLCLDTGHAISNGVTYWQTSHITDWVKHVHFNDNIPLKDEHLPIGPDTDKLMIGRLKYLMQTASNNGVVILEHRKLEEALQSKDYICTQMYGSILPTP